MLVQEAESNDLVFCTALNVPEGACGPINANNHRRRSFHPTAYVFPSLFVRNRARVSQVIVWPLLLPRAGSRAEDVRADRVEHPVRVQRVGSQDFGAAACHVPQRERKVTRAHTHTSSFTRTRIDLLRNVANIFHDTYKTSLQLLVYPQSGIGFILAICLVAARACSRLEVPTSTEISSRHHLRFLPIEILFETEVGE